ncbi:hypothetical protein WA158_001952 [Blastocystis sp. Blastoise]
MNNPNEVTRDSVSSDGQDNNSTHSGENTPRPFESCPQFPMMPFGYGPFMTPPVLSSMSLNGYGRYTPIQKGYPPFPQDFINFHKNQRMRMMMEENKKKLSQNIDTKRNAESNVTTVKNDYQKKTSVAMCPFLGFGRIESREYDNYYMLLVDLPGMSKEDVIMEIEDNFLIVSCNRPEKDSGPEYKVMYTERATGNFERKFEIMNDIQVDGISGDYKNGVLYVKLPKKQVGVKPERKKILLN